MYKMTPMLSTALDLLHYFQPRSRELDDSVQRRQAVENAIAFDIVCQAVADGFYVSVFDSEETTVSHSRSIKEIMAALMTTDDDTLIFSAKVLDTGESVDYSRVGWVKLIYGNDGWDVTSDWTDNEITNRLVDASRDTSDFFYETMER